MSPQNFHNGPLLWLHLGLSAFFSSQLTFVLDLNKIISNIVESVGFAAKMDVHDWLDEDGLKKLKADRQPFEAPSCHYTPKPNEPGKMFWFSGKASMDNNN